MKKIISKGGMLIICLILLLMNVGCNKDNAFVSKKEKVTDEEFFYAVENEDKILIDNIVKKDKSYLQIKDSEGKTPLIKSIVKQKYDIANLLVDEGTDLNMVDKYELSALRYCARGKDDEQKVALIKKMINKGCKVDDYVFQWALANNYETTKLLIDKGFDVNDKTGVYTSNPLFIAIDNGKTDIVKLLIDNNADIHFKWKEESFYNFYSTLTQLAVARGNREIVEMLYNKGFDINEKGQYGETLLMKACKAEKNDIYDFLIQKGADENVKNEWGETVEDIKEEKIRRNNIKNKSTSNTESIKKEPKIGMTAEEVRNSKWGKPTEINKTTTAYGVTEQWVYSNYRYVYLKDGFVTAIQDHN